MNSVFDFLQLIFGRVLQASLQATLLGVLILAVQWALRGQLLAGWRNALWLLVFIRLLMPALPPTRFSAYNWLTAKSAPPTLQQQSPIQPQPAFPIVPAQAPSSVPVESKPSLATVTPAIPEGTKFKPRHQTADWWRSLPLLSLAWATGATAMLLAGSLGYLRLRKRIARLQKPVPAALLKQFEETKAELKVSRVELLVSEAVSAPIVTGLWRRKIVLPVSMDAALDSGEIRMVLLHELAHVKRGDLWIAWLAWFAGALHWFNPAIRVAISQARKDRELACDERVLRIVSDAGAYGSALVRFLEFAYAAQPRLGTVGIFESKSALIQRVRYIAAYRRPTFLASLAGLALMCTLGVLTLTGANTPKKSSAPVLELPPGEVLLQAIIDNAPDKAEAALKAGADPNKQGDWAHAGYLDQNTPLYFAADQGKLALCQLLVAHGASVKSGGSSWTNPIEGALRSGHPEVAKFLHEQGATVDPLVYAAGVGDHEALKSALAKAKPNTIKEAAETAAGCNQQEILQTLLEHGGDKTKAFLRASTTGAVDAMRFLLKQGIDLKAIGYEALRQAAYHDQTPAAALLLKEGVPANDPTPGGISALHPAAQVGAVGTVKLLLEAGADPNSLTVLGPKDDPSMSGQYGDWGDSPIFEACHSDNAEIARLLLDSGARLDIVNRGGFTPVLYAAYTHAPRCLALLIDRGADTKAFNPNWKSGIIDFAAIFTGEDANRPDMRATKARINQAMETVQVLLDRGWDVNTVDEKGFSFLSIAISNGQTAWTKRLLELGANINVVDHFGSTLLIRSMISPQEEKQLFATIDQLFACGINPNAGLNNPITTEFGAVPSELKTALFCFQKPETKRKLVQLLLSKGARFPVEKGSAAEQMLVAASTGDLAKVKELLQKGVSPNVADAKGWTPLLSAAAMGDSAMLRALVEAGADVKTRDALGLAPQWFTFRFMRDQSDLRYLVEKGADVNTVSTAPFFNPMINLAIAHNDPDLVRYLLEHGANPNLLPGLDKAHVFEPLAYVANQLNQSAGKDQKQREIFKMLLKAGASPSPTGPDKRSHLYFPVVNNHVDLVKFMIEAGIDPKKDPDGGKELAQMAELHGNKETKALIKAALEVKPDR
jgi:bla regulator protein BlaR1